MDTPITRAEHEEFVRRMDDEHRRIHHRVTEVEKTADKIHDLATAVERMATSVEQIAKVQLKHDEQIECLEARDGEMWRKVVSYAITAVVGIVIGFVFNQIGL